MCQTIQIMSPSNFLISDSSGSSKHSSSWQKCDLLISENKIRKRENGQITPEMFTRHLDRGDRRTSVREILQGLTDHVL